ncbi:MAG: hypothetical protein LBL07_01075, partial [Tannerella sp.]|nr:hypothetical protein [Tannerella sp.]
MRSKAIIAGVSFLLLVACNDIPTRLEQALVLAGENRSELEKVLVHYAADPSDSLKYRAACY